jgi:penicillin amidase
MVVELSDPLKAWGVYPGGQSGSPSSINYDNGIDKWAKGSYFELHLYKNAKEAVKDGGKLFEIE